MQKIAWSEKSPKRAFLTAGLVPSVTSVPRRPGLATKELRAARGASPRCRTEPFRLGSALIADRGAGLSQIVDQRPAEALDPSQIVPRPERPVMHEPPNAVLAEPAHAIELLGTRRVEVDALGIANRLRVLATI
jgi:hypothetical protein